MSGNMHYNYDNCKFKNFKLFRICIIYVAKKHYTMILASDFLRYCKIYSARYKISKMMLLAAI